MAQRPAMQMKRVNETFTVRSVAALGADWLKEATRAKRQCRRHREGSVSGRRSRADK
ncbi:MAG: hypothetical protein IKN22_02040 [Bacteroidaceae bacterium]|nr:hypothetical protein [Bacteroidaceae bacterium]